MPNPYPDEEFARMRERADRLHKLIDEAAELLREAQANLFALTNQNAKPLMLEEQRGRAVSLYEAYLDLVIEQHVIEGRLQD